MKSIDKLRKVVETVERVGDDNKSEPWMKEGFGKKQEEEFFCLCGSREYRVHRGNNGVYGPGYQGWIIHFECSGCSAIFHDPKKYSEGQKNAEKRLRVAHIPI
jgi:hypothetical protein